MADKCKNCCYYDKVDISDLGLCKRFPPVISVLSDKVYFNNSTMIDNRRPLTEKDDFCGEYKAK
jgi:hypothetical protein